MPESTGFLATLRKDPAFMKLLDSAKDYGVAKAGSIADKSAAKDPGGPVAQAKAEGKKGAILGGIKGFFKGLGGKKGGAKRPTNIYEYVFLGVPVDVAWDAWHEYHSFPTFMKGPEKADKQEKDGDGNKIGWTAKIFINRRSWSTQVEDEIEGERIQWKTTESKKGAVDGTVTFTPLGDNLTLMVLVVEYRSKGIIEWTGNRWRTVGRRVRLDLKHFARHVMMDGYEHDEENTQDSGEDSGDEQPTAPEPTGDETAEATDQPPATAEQEQREPAGV